MPSERVQRQLDQLLDEAEAAIRAEDWAVVGQRVRSVLALDPDNRDALSYLAASERALSAPAPPDPASVAAQHAAQLRPQGEQPRASTTPLPAAFANGRYAVKRFLGEGGKKKVYLAHDALLDRDVAFALIKTEGLDEIARLRIQHEAQAMGRLGDHPNIVTIFDIGNEPVPRTEVRGMSPGTQPYMVLPLMPGGDVEGLIEKAEEHKLPLERALQIASQVCEGLEFAHKNGVVHRDLKPGNVWLTDQGVAKIGDFGLAVAVDRSRLTQAGMMVGTVSYMPPEQAMGGEVGPRSDLYSLGAMLYEMVCGRPPFVGDESVAIIGQHLNTPPVAPSWHRPDCRPALEALILRLLEKDPQKRPASAKEVGDILLPLTLTLSQREREHGSVRPEVLEGRTRAAPDENSGPNTDSRMPIANPLYRSTFVGREQELKQLQAAFDGALSGNGGLVMVVGEPGIGKTALCEQLATYAALRGGRALVGHCYEEGSISLPYLAFVEAMRSYVLAREPDGLKADLGSGAAEVARIVSEVRDRVQGVELRPAGDPEDDRWRLLQAVSGFLRSAATVQPLLIVLEDLHWADRGTLDLLQHLARNLQGARLLVVGTYRDVEVDRSHPLSAALAELRRSGSLPRVLLRGLTVDEVHRMYEAIRGQSVAWAQAELVHRQTEGHPLFVQEVLRYLVEEGFVVREAGRYQVKPEAQANEAVLPDGLRDVVGRRLSRLSEKTNQVLSVAAVMGREFRLDVLQKLLGPSAEQGQSPLPGERVRVRGDASIASGASMTEDDLFAALEEAQSRAIIEQRPLAGALGFRFSHAFFRQTLYEEIFTPRRIRLHQQVGRALEELYGAVRPFEELRAGSEGNRRTNTSRFEEHAAELAEHFAQSTEIADLEKAVHYGELAAQRAMSVYAYGEASRHLEQALRAQEVLDPDDKAARCALLSALAEVLAFGGEPRRALDSIAPEALALAEALGDRQRASEICRVAILTFQAARSNRGWDSTEAAGWAQAADRSAEPGTIARVWADAALGRVSSASGRMTEGRGLVTRALDLAREFGDNAAIWFAGMMWFETVRGVEAEALALAEDLYERSREGVSSLVWRTASIGMNSAFFAYGDREKFEVVNRETAALAERTKQPNLELLALFRRASQSAVHGRLEEATALFDDVQARAEELGLVEYLSGFGTARARALLHLGRAEEILRLPVARAGPNIMQALALAIGKRDAEAREILDAAMQRRSNLFGSGEIPVFVTVMGLEVAVLAGHAEAARQQFDRAEGTELPLANAAQLFCLHRIMGSGAAFLGRHEAAKHYYGTALKGAEKLGFRPEIALVRLGLAELLLAHYPDERAGAIEHLDFAIREFQEMKMQPSLERALRHREILKA